jgi:hypothetical protein
MRETKRNWKKFQLENKWYGAFEDAAKSFEVTICCDDPKELHEEGLVAGPTFDPMGETDPPPNPIEPGPVTSIRIKWVDPASGDLSTIWVTLGSRLLDVRTAILRKPLVGKPGNAGSPTTHGAELSKGSEKE